jgi:hypothetical protein
MLPSRQMRAFGPAAAPAMIATFFVKARHEFFKIE